jgi:release factor glutamine methyltransferase
VVSVDLHAADVDPAAVACARRNLPGAGIHQGDLFAALPPDLRGRIDVLVANAPYVPTAAIGLMPPEAREHEPPVALDGGDDGLAVLRRIVAGAPGWLSPRGALLFETGTGQVPDAVAALRMAGLEPLVVEDEERGATVVVGSR